MKYSWKANHDADYTSDNIACSLFFIYRFCVGDRFYLCENKILCEYDYEERLAFANMALQSPASLAYIKRQLPPTPTPPGQNIHPGHNPLQAHQGLGQSVAQHNHVANVSANKLSKWMIESKLGKWINDKSVNKNL